MAVFISDEYFCVPRTVLSTKDTVANIWGFDAVIYIKNLALFLERSKNSNQFYKGGPAGFCIDLCSKMYCAVLAFFL